MVVMVGSMTKVLISMLLNLSIILSSNSFLFTYYFHFSLIYSPPRLTIKLATYNYTLNYIVFID